MTVNTGNFSVKLGQQIKCTLSTSSNLQLMELSKSVQLLGNGTVRVVTNCADLPSACGRTGQIYFVTAEERLYFAENDTAGWIPLGQTAIQNLYTWGKNNFGQLGTNGTTNRSSPGTTVGCGVNWCSISAGNYNSGALKSDGTLWTWGFNPAGMLGSNSTVWRSSPGTVAGAGKSWCQLDMRHGYSAHATKVDGTLWSWGCNRCGKLGINSVSDRSSPGTVSGGGTSWCIVSSGLYHAAAIKTNGTLWTWGGNSYGQLGTNASTNTSSPVTIAGGGYNWCQIGLGKYHSGAIKSDGTLWTWGRNADIATGDGALGNNSTVNTSSPGTVAGAGTTWRGVSSGWGITAAIKTDGTLWTWGSGMDGQLAHNSTVSRSSPGTTVGGGTTWCQVSLSRFFSGAAVKTDGTLWTWGKNLYGQLGTNNVTYRSSPGTVVGLNTGWCAVDSSQQTLAIRLC